MNRVSVSVWGAGNNFLMCSKITIVVEEQKLEAFESNITMPTTLTRPVALAFLIKNTNSTVKNIILWELCLFATEIHTWWCFFFWWISQLQATESQSCSAARENKNDSLGVVFISLLNILVNLIIRWIVRMNIYWFNIFSKYYWKHWKFIKICFSAHSLHLFLSECQCGTDLKARHIIRNKSCSGYFIFVFQRQDAHSLVSKKIARHEPKHRSNKKNAAWLSYYISSELFYCLILNTPKIQRKIEREWCDGHKFINHKNIK